MLCGASERHGVRDDGQHHDEEPSGLHLHGLAEPRRPSVKGKHVLGEHRRQREDLRVARHHRRHDAGAQEAGQPQRRVPLQHHQHHVVAGRLPPERRALVGRHGRGRRRERRAGLELLLDAGHVLHGVRRQAEERAREPDGENAQRIEDDGAPELLHAPRGETEDRDVRKGDRRERDERVAEEEERRHALARQERRGGGRRRAGVSIAAEKPPMPRPMTNSATAPNDRNSTV